MQDINPKDRPKLIAVGVATVVVLGIGAKMTIDSIIAVSPAPASASPAAATTPTATAVISTGPAAPVAVVAATGAPQNAGLPATADDPGVFILDGNYAGPNGRDPFTPVPDSITAKFSERVQEVMTPPSPVPNPGILSVPSLPPIGRGMAGQFAKAIGGMNEHARIVNGIIDGGEIPPLPKPTVRVLTPPAPPYTVTGVLIGEPGGTDVAILRRDVSGEKKFVVVGDPLEGGYTVTAIESGGVKVKHPGRPAITTNIPNAAPVPIPGTTESYKPKVTTRVESTTSTLPLGGSANPGAPANVPPIQ